MSNTFVALIAAGAAILSSVLTSYLTHLFERRRKAREYELEWLEERFSQAISFLGRVLSRVANTPNTHEDRASFASRIKDIVDGPSQEENAWCIAVMLDPENTGLRRYVLSTIAYANIGNSAEEFTQYWARTAVDLELLIKEYDRERNAILRGVSLEKIIGQRKEESDLQMSKYHRAVNAVKGYLSGEMDLAKSISEIKASGIRDSTLGLFLQIPVGLDDETRRLAELKDACEEQGWLIDQKF